jgi:hypothetical protein
MLVAKGRLILVAAASAPSVYYAPSQGGIRELFKDECGPRCRFLWGEAGLGPDTITPDRLGTVPAAAIRVLFLGGKKWEIRRPRHRKIACAVLRLFKREV